MNILPLGHKFKYERQKVVEGISSNANNHRLYHLQCDGYTKLLILYDVSWEVVLLVMRLGCKVRQQFLVL